MPARAQEPQTGGYFLAAWRAFLEDCSFLREYGSKYRKLMLTGLLALVVTDTLEIVPPILLMYAVDIATKGEAKEKLLQIALLYMGIAVLQAIGRYGWRMYLIRASMLAGRDLRGRFARHLFGLAQSFFDRRPIGELMSLSTNDVEAVRMMLGAGLLVLADAIFYFLTVPVAMFLLSPKLTLLAFLPLPFLPWLVLRNEREIHSRFEKVQESFSEISAMTQESLNGVRVLKGFAREDTQARRFREAGENYSRLSLRLARVQSSFGPILDFTMSFGLFLLLFVGGRQIIEHGDAAITLGTFVAFQRYIQKMVWPMAALGVALGTYQRSISSSSRLKEVFGRETDVPESPQPVAPRACEGRIELKNLVFSFPATDRAVLRGVNLMIEPGERVAFVGTIGSGKSALLSLLPRLYPVARGMIRIDGVDVNDWPIDALRKHVGYVSQDIFLFSESVLENVAYGLHESTRSASRDRIEEATSLSCVHAEVLGLTGAYGTLLGERGVNLSGGQKQRLTIARAIIKKPPVLILDDALSSVDVQTEERILKGLRSRPGRNTELIAAHRISTIQDADRIVVLERGEISQLGTHTRLIAERNGLYRKFYDQQRLKEDLERYVESIDVKEPEEART